jgi:hypothetical protein
MLVALEIPLQEVVAIGPGVVIELIIATARVVAARVADIKFFVKLIILVF